jgi:hypothetical protein
MTFRQRTLQLFFLFLGVILVAMFVVRWLAPDSRAMLWRMLCPPNSRIELNSGEAELEPGEVVNAYEVVCVGQDFRIPLSDIQLLLVETGFPLGLSLLLALIFGWITTRDRIAVPDTETNTLRNTN